jgi:hypothetical protein
MIQPHYYKGERGNKPYDLELMLQINLVQNLYDLSDIAVRGIQRKNRRSCYWVAVHPVRQSRDIC